MHAARTPDVYPRRSTDATPSLELLEPRLMLSAGVVINEFMAINDTVLADSLGEYYDWIELHNPTASPVNLDGWHLTDDADELDDWRIPAVTLAPDEYLIIFASGLDRRVVGQELHTNFKLTGGGEYLALTDPAEMIVHEYAPAFPQQLADYSYGISGGEEHFFSPATPGAANTGIFDVCQDVVFSVPHGIFYDLSETFTLELSTPTPSATIWYTVNGDAPTNAGSTRVAYTGPMTIDQSRVIRAAATRSGYSGSTVTTQTYIFLDSVLTQSDDQSAMGLPDTWYNTNGGTSVSNPEGFVRDADYEVDPDVALSKDDLLGIPSMALTVTGFDLFDPETGIYVNPIQRVADDGSIWEKPASFELIDPAGGEDFSVNAGARIHGELARWVICNAKFNFRITFEEEYGPTKLETDFFPDSDVNQYDTLVLRAGWGKSFLLDPTLKPPEYPNYPTFVSGDPTSSMYLRDQVAHDLFASTGQASVEGRFVHLYLNGLYWGLYQVIERPAASYNAEHFGGEKQDWDVIKGGVGYTEVNGMVKSGNRDAWNELFSFFDFNGANNTTNVTPVSDSDYETIKQYMDMENFADQMITLAYIGRADFPRKNWYAAGLPGAPGEPMIEPFRFYVWDSEASMWSSGSNRLGTWESSSNDTGPVRLWRRLIRNDQFKLLLADRLHKHLFNDGGMTPEAAAATFQTRVDEIYDAIVGESARWGDFANNRTDNPLLRDVEWIAEYNWFINSYFPYRTANLLEDFEQAGLYPGLDAAEFNQHGGVITATDPITLSAPTGTIWYTTDGADPRLGDGAVTGVPVGATSITLVDESDAKRVFIPTDSNGGDQLGTTWLDYSFSDGGWILGSGGVGYDTGGTNYDPYIDIDVESVMDNVNTSAFIRIPFNVDAEDLATFDFMEVGVRCDDGFVVYLNGVVIAQNNNKPDDVPGVPKWNNEAVNYNDEGQAVTLRTWTADNFINLLVPGDNMLAIHGLNAGLGSSDFLLSANLVAGDSGNGNGGNPDDVSPTAIQYTGAFQLPMTSTVKARVYNGSEWSALTEAIFAIDASADMRISEINYHPVGPTAAELAVNAMWTGSDFEFIELTNTGPDPIGLSGVQIVDGIEFDFVGSPITTLAPGEYVVAAANIEAFEARYGTSVPLAGEFGGALRNGGEQLVLADSTGVAIQSFRYDDSGAWPNRADGNGSTLEIIDPAGDYADGDNWRSSNEYGGSPGAAGTGPIVDVVVNEVLTHTDLPIMDAIELYNTSGAPVDISGWFLSDSSGNFSKFRIPDGTVLGVGEYIEFDEVDFNLTGLTPDPSDDLPTDFALNGAHGDDVWLLTADAGGKLLRFADHVEFGAALRHESFGRWPNGSGELYPMIAETLGNSNAGPRIGPVVIGEVMYNPDTTLVMPLRNFIDTGFDADADSFTYADDVLGTNNAPFAEGTYAPAGGETGGGIDVTLGLGSPGASSGGWSADFRLAEPDSVSVSLDVRLMMDAGYGTDDYGEAVLTIDGVRYGPADDFSLLHIDGDGPGGGPVDTGWLSLFVNVGLAAGDHTLTLGAFNNNAADLTEFVQVGFDNVTVTGTADRADLEYIEIYNPGPGTEDLTGWRLRRGADYDFDPGLMLGPGERLVVLSYDPDDPANADRVALFRSTYGVSGSITLVGGWGGQLNNAGETIQLQSPDHAPDGEPGFTPHVVEDEVTYGPLAPWPTSPDGGGNSLTRLGAGWGHDPASWAADTPSPGTGPGAPSGDFDGDGDVDLEDFVILKQNFGQVGGATPATGDANGDGDVNLDDFVILKQQFAGAASAREAASHDDSLLSEPVATDEAGPVDALDQAHTMLPAPRVVLARPDGLTEPVRRRARWRALRPMRRRSAAAVVDVLGVDPIDLPL